MDQDKRVEAALFSAGKPVRVSELAKAADMGADEVRSALARLRKRYSSGSTALEIAKAGDKYVMQVKEDYIRPALPLSKTDIPRPVIKTLSLIAYHQPMRQRQLLEMLGNRVYAHTKELKRLGLIKEGREKRFKVWSTTNRFPEYFGLETTDRNEIKKLLAKHAGVVKD